MKKQAPPVTFTEESLRELQAVYDVAIAAGQELFQFRERTYSVRYTHYLLQHLRDVFRERPKGGRA